jgi:hypothetical protein
MKKKEPKTLMLVAALLYHDATLFLKASEYGVIPATWETEITRIVVWGPIQAISMRKLVW